MATPESKQLWDELTFAYTETQGHPLLLQEIATLYTEVCAPFLNCQDLTAHRCAQVSKDWSETDAAPGVVKVPEAPVGLQGSQGWSCLEMLVQGFWLGSCLVRGACSASAPLSSHRSSSECGTTPEYRLAPESRSYIIRYYTRSVSRRHGSARWR